MTLSRSSIATLSIILAVILFFALNIFASSAFRTWRLDLTQGSLYSISDGTVRTLKSIQEPVTLKFYFSETTAAPYASVRAYGQRVRDILQQYAAMAGGKIRLEVIDPIPFSEAEEQAAAAGLQGAPIPSGERIYFGLTGSNTIDGRETIPVFLPDREKFLEYDLTALIYNLIREKKPLIGIVSNLPLDTGSGGLEAAMQGRSKPYFIYEQLRQFYETKFLEQDFDRVPADIDVLMIVHPKKLGDRALYAIDQFVMRGGRVLAFLDPNSILSQTQGPQGQPLAGSELSSAASLGPVLQSWGVEIDPKFVVADQSLAQKVNLGGGNVADYLVWLGITPANMDVKDRVTANLRPLNLGTAGIISALEKRTTTVVPLVRTTANSMQVDVKEVEGRPEVEELLREFRPGGERFDIGVRISGPVKSAFADGPPKDALEKKPVAEGATAPEPLPAHLKESKGPANIILLADADVFNDDFWVQIEEIAGQRIGAREVGGNMAFVLNAVEDLSGSNELISLRSRGDMVRPFTTVDTIRRRAEASLLRQKQLLETKLNDAAARIEALEGQRPDQAKALQSDGTLNFTPEQRAELERFRTEYGRTKRELRDVQLQLNQDIDRLKSWLAAFNMGFVPAAIGIGLLFMGWWRTRKKEQAAAAEQAGLAVTEARP